MNSFPFPVDLTTFVLWLASPAAVGILVSFLLEKLPWWHELPELPNWVPNFLAGIWDKLQDNWSRAKQVIVFGLGIGLPRLSTWVLGIVPPTYWDAGQVYVNYAIQGLIVWFSAELFHTQNPTRNRYAG